jgi:hypothetical protein
MRHLRRTVLAALALALCAAPAAAAADRHNDHSGAVVAPAKDAWLGESWAQIYSLPVPVNPFAGNGNPCLTLAHKVIQEIGRPCTIEEGTTFTLFFGSAWSSAEDPFPQTKAEQLTLAIAWDRENVVDMTVTVDGDDPVEIRTPRFELFSAQQTVLLPADQIFGLPGPQTVTLSAHGWGAAIRKLHEGEHVIVGDVQFADGQHSLFPHVLTVVSKHDHGDSAHRDGA